jgi:molybdate transport system substrate-binding protein
LFCDEFQWQNTVQPEELAMKLFRLAIAAIVIVVLLGASVGLRAQTQLTLLSPNPITEPLEKIVTNFQNKTGIQVKITYGTGVSTRKTVENGGALDVTLLFAPFPDALKTGNIVANSATVVATLRLAMGVKKGAPKPDISNADAVRRTLLNAKSIMAIDPAQGSAGGAAAAAFEKLGITEQLKSKITWARNAAVVQDTVAKGDAEIAIGPYYSEMRNPGLDVVGALPPDASTPIDITGFLSTSVKYAKEARELLDYLKGPDAAPIWEEAKDFPVR